MARPIAGQGALLPLPASPFSSELSVESYEIPSHLKGERKTMKDAVDGFEVLKVSKNGKFQARRFAFSADNRAILITSNRIRSVKNLFKYATQNGEVTAKTIVISTIVRLQLGGLTNRFILARELAHEDPEDFSEDSTCLSIIYRTPGGQFESLDLVVPKEQEYEALVETLQDLLELHFEERKQSALKYQFLQFHWIEMEKQLGDLLSASEWTTMSHRMNVPVKKAYLIQHYKEFRNDIESEEDLTLTETLHLLEEVHEVSHAVNGINAENDFITKIWKGLVKEDPLPILGKEHEADEGGHEMEMDDGEQTISAVAFLSFIRSEQKQYKITLEQVHDLITILTSQVTAGDDSSKDDQKVASDRIPQSRFMAYLTSDANDLLDPQTGEVGHEELTAPLSHYWINTSHDTYLAKLTSESFGPMPKTRDTLANALTADLQSYTTALLRGVRAVEIDAYDGLYQTQGPVVARRAPASGADHVILFSDIIRAVRSFLKSNPKSLPILLLIENHCTLKNQKLMAMQLKEILGELLYSPPAGVANSNRLPSPESLRGKVVIKGKRPKRFKEGATVTNNDFDDDIVLPDEAAVLQDVLEDDEEEDDEDLGFVTGFEASGPIRSKASDVEKKSSSALLKIAHVEAEEARLEFERAMKRSEDLRSEAKDAEETAAKLASAAGLSMAQVKARVLGNVDDEGTEVDLTTFRKLTDDSNEEDKGESETETEAGVEVQEIIEKTVEGARIDYSAADDELLQAMDKAASAALRLEDAEDALIKAQLELAESYEREKESEAAAARAAADARAKREHAETARSRVDDVREILRNWKNSANSAETVVHTAMTEAKISDQRAADTEARAIRAATNAEKDKLRAESETEKEERLEREAANLHEKSVLAANEARIAREKMEKAAKHLDKVNEQIKLIEKSSQYKKEMSEGGPNAADSSVDDESSDRTPRHVSKFVAKHAAKLQQRDDATKALSNATNEHGEAEKSRRSAQEAFEEMARLWKIQADASSKARKQADRSATLAEELLEHAEEEREAAALRKIAHEKAENSVHQSDSYKSSVQAQLLEAERASTEASNLALESRSHAEKLARDAADAKDHSIPFSTLEARKLQHKEALRVFEAAEARKKRAESMISEAKRRLDTSSEVLSSAKRDAAAEIHRMNAEKQFLRGAILGYNKAMLSQKQATHAASLARLANTAWEEKKAALSQARIYKEKQDKVAPVSLELATMTLLDSHKFRYWEKSLTLPCTHMHSFSQGSIFLMLGLDTQVKNLLKLSREHICRTFPSWKATDRPSLNYNPVSQWALGCQLVSMNFHAADEHLLVNDGRFRMNGSSGYVLKPHYLLKDGHPAERWQHWNFQVLSGQCLPKPQARRGLMPSSQVNPYVRVTLYDGVSGKDSCKVVYTTKPVERNGLNPVWDSGDEFEVAVERPSIAVLLFSVWDKRADGSSNFIAGAAFPVACLREGYRSVSLFDSLHTKSGPFAFASLFVKAHKVSD